MDVLYTVAGDRLVLELDAAAIDRRATFERLRRLGAPLSVESDGIVTRASAPRAGLREVASACAMLGARLVPAEGAPALETLAKATPRYEDLRPDDPDAVVGLAAQDEAPLSVLEAAIRRLRSFALAQPGFGERAQRDVQLLERAAQRYRAKTTRPEPATDPVRLEVSRALQGVPAADLWRARDHLLGLHRLVGAAPALPHPQAPVPDPIPGFRGKLRPYQRVGVSFLLARRLNAVLADEMGTGKTITTIAAVLAAGARALVVCPANVLHNWAAEVERFTGEPAAIWHGRDAGGDDAARFRITTYDSLRLLDWRRTDAATRDVLVLDEAHYVRNPDTLRARTVKDLPQTRRILLSGTPIVNGFDDYNELLLHVGETRWADAAAFRDAWVKDPELLARHPQVRAATADLLHRATGNVVLRRRKDDVLQDLPPRTVAIHRHALSDDEAAVYEGLQAAARDALSRATSEVQVFAHLHRLRQHLARCRIPFLEERVRELLASAEAAVVYSHYLEPIRQLRARLGDTAAVIDGSTPPRERERIARALGTPEGPQVLLAQMEAGGVGLNFVGARYVLFAHLGWTAAVHRQAIDRVHRIGQSRPVQVEFVVTPGTIDERMADIILRKEADANLALADTGDVLDRATLARVLLEATPPAGGAGGHPSGGPGPASIGPGPNK